MAWGTTIFPLFNGGIKILDLEAQTTTLLAKMLVRGFVPRPKLWKVLLCHWVVNLRQSYKGC